MVILRVGSDHESSGMGRFVSIHLIHFEFGPNSSQCVTPGSDQTGAYLDCESLWAQGALSHLSESPFVGILRMGSDNESSGMDRFVSIHLIHFEFGPN